MSIKELIGAAFVCSAFLVSCQKVPQGMMLLAEGFNGGKAAVEGNSSYWVDGETVRINNSDYNVTVADGNAYATDVTTADNYYALYPNTLAPSADLTTGSATVAIPSYYVYRKAGGLQALDLPMAAYGSSNSRLMFKHLTAAVTVWVVNNFGIDIQVDSIVLTSSHYQISGNRSITFGNSLNVDTLETDNTKDRRVAVRFNGGTTLKINCGDSVAVQVPVLPVGLKNKFTITVAVHNADESTMKYTFNRTQASDGHALLRAQIGYAPARFGGKFSVGGGKKIYFAPGNLQYFCSTTTPRWRFALHQYDTAEFSGAYYANNSEHWIDLFGFATSGYSHNNKDYFPYYTSTTSLSNYYPGTGIDDISKTNYDWGWYNPIENGGNIPNRWRTITVSEWAALATNDRLVKARLANSNAKRGLILLPDNFQVPEGITLKMGGSRSFTDNNLTLDQWKKMEVAGAVFFPLVMRREGTVKKARGNSYYWTSTMQNSGNAESSYGKEFMFHDSEVKTENSILYLGLAVRLVRDAN